MHRTMRGGIAALVAAGVVLGGASVAAAKPSKQSPAKYAKTVCGAYTRLEADITSYAGAIGNLDPSDPAAFATQAAAQTNTLLTTVRADEKTLQGAYPDISNGKKVGTLLATNATEVESGLTSALGQLQTGGVAAPTLFKVGIETLGTKISDPFSKVKDQTLINAFQKEKSCKNVVQVVGG